ncbi:Endonuclease V [Ananas comosus]|uniref:Endonuclease V n=1 Tax=Ananas comosus TaxID=4615 RepID=A0A199W1B8_ANACO|nr:Endonuclease V [Ananas comosus]
MEDSFQEDGDASISYQQEWIKTQDLLKRKLVLEDDFGWKVPSKESNLGGSGNKEKLKYIGGVDISFLKEDPSLACGAVVVLDADTLKVVHEEFDIVRLQVPYIPGFLAFREAPILLGLLEKMKTNAHPFYPQAMRSTPGSSKPIYISVGHRISLDSAVKVTKLCSKFRVPEPTRQADMRSKVFLRQQKGSIHMVEILS